MKQCPICGEKYADSYKSCPFCEEEKALEQGETIRRKGGSGGKRKGKHRGGRTPNGPRMLSPILVIIIVLLACLLIYLLFGDRLAGGGQQNADEPQKQEEIDQGQGEEPVLPTEDGTSENDPQSQSGGKTMSYQKAAALPKGLTLDREDVTLRDVNESFQLKVSGGSGDYQWISEDPQVAEVSQDGRVKTLSRGTINVVVTDGEKQATCIVRVNVPDTARGEATGSGGSHSLNREDMTLSVGESFQLKLSGVESRLQWSSGDSGVAKVSGDGTVTGVAAGKTTITVSWDGSSKSCTVYVKQ